LNFTDLEIVYKLLPVSSGLGEMTFCLNRRSHSRSQRCKLVRCSNKTKQTKNKPNLDPVPASQHEAESFVNCNHSKSLRVDRDQFGPVHGTIDTGLFVGNLSLLFRNLANKRIVPVNVVNNSVHDTKNKRDKSHHNRSTSCAGRVLAPRPMLMTSCSASRYFCTASVAARVSRFNCSR
jgi:hypothetical protein